VYVAVTDFATWELPVSRYYDTIWEAD